MKISKIVNKKVEEVDEMKRFDTSQAPTKPWSILKPLMWLIAFPEIIKRHYKINKVNMDGLKPPYVLICTHMSFIDFKITTAAIMPHRANYVVAIDGFINRETLLTKAGCICKRKFTNSLALIRQIKEVVDKNKNIIAIYAEARYSLVGTTAILPDSLGKLVKMLKVPVVVLNMHGHYLLSPVWNLKKRKLDIISDMTQILTKDQVLNSDVDYINQQIRHYMEYDEYKWQKDNNIHITEPFRAEGLHKPLYKCPICGSEHDMASKGTKLFCKKCNSSWEMTELGELKNEKTGEFTHIPNWYEWERSEVRREINNGTYKTELIVDIDSLPNSKGFYRLGEGKLIHDLNGFRINGDFDKPFSLEKAPDSTYSVHIEYEYFGKGDCVSLSTMNDTYYFFPHTEYCIVTKLHFAAEELFKVNSNKK